MIFSTRAVRLPQGPASSGSDWRDGALRQGLRALICGRSFFRIRECLRFPAHFSDVAAVCFSQARGKWLYNPKIFGTGSPEIRFRSRRRSESVGGTQLLRILRNKFRLYKRAAGCEQIVKLTAPREIRSSHLLAALTIELCRAHVGKMPSP